MNYEEKLKELGLFSTEEEKTKEDLLTVFKFLKGGYKEDKDRFFSVAAGDRTRNNSLKF